MSEPVGAILLTAKWRDRAKRRGGPNRTEHAFMMNRQGGMAYLRTGRFGPDGRALGPVKPSMVESARSSATVRRHGTISAWCVRGARRPGQGHGGLGGSSNNNPAAVVKRIPGA
jgi:hypothetical protein